MAQVSYAGPRELNALRPEALVTWSFKNRLRTVRLKGDRFVKAEFCTAEELDELRHVAGKLGVPAPFNPSSFGSLFHELGSPAPMNYATRLLVPTETIDGAWEERRAEGGVGAREYDMISAYAWAGLRELPCHSTAWGTRKWAGRGIYLCKVLRLGRIIPYPRVREVLISGETLWLTSEEIEELDLTVEIVRGVIFDKWWNPRERIEKIIAAAPEPLWKKMLRSYWGSWASVTPTTCWARRTGNTWLADNPFHDPVAAHFIVSRVRNRIAQVAGLALHIFVDAIITRHRLTTGAALGDWRVKAEYDRVRIAHPGRSLGILQDGSTLEKRSGATEPIHL